MDRPALTAPRELRPALSATLAVPVLWAPAPQPAAPAERVLPRVRSGDLVFLDLDCGPLCDAMAEVTQEQFGVPGPRLSHVGIVELEGGEPFVWEVWPGRGVSRVGLRAFLDRVGAGEGRPGGFYVGRLPDAARPLAGPALARVRALSGSPYDPGFAWDGRGLYCAKLVACAFGDVFKPRPMYFGREGSRAREVWRAYFASHHMAVPDGLPGVSPLGIYLDLLAWTEENQP